jgi:hypothetical protein
MQEGSPRVFGARMPVLPGRLLATLGPQAVRARVPAASLALRASVLIPDRREPPFSIGFPPSRRGGRRLATTISPLD